MSKMTTEETIEFLELEKESTKTLWDNVNHEGGREYFEKSLEVLDTAIKALKEQPMRDATEEERKSVKDYIESISKPTGVRFGIQPTSAKETIIKSALKYLIKKQIEEGGVGFAVDNDPDHDCCWDDVLAWLEARPCEDCISREEINEFINVKLTNNEEWASSATNEGRWVEEKTYLYGVEILEDIDEYVKTMPPVTPQRSKGKWIEVLEHRDEFGSTWHYECSECGGMSYKGIEPLEKYYPNCGAEMSGGEEDGDSN